MARPKSDPPIEAHVKVASLADGSPEDVAKLQATIADLRAQLGVVAEERDEATRAALASAEAQGSLMQREIREVATGKYVTVQRCKGYRTAGYENRRPILEPLWEDVELPTYFYKIDMPPVGGTDLKTNDVPMYQGVVYTVDIDTLRTIKERIFRMWEHDANIHGKNENAYRQPQSARV